MTLDAKVEAAETLIAKCLELYRRPIVACSFGKDSMVLLHMVRSQRKTPVLFYRDPFFPEKYDFANSVIAEWDLNVYDYPPMSTSVAQSKETYEITFNHQIGPEKYIGRGMEITNPVPGQTYLCGYRDLYQRPLGLFNFAWDLMFHGHKNSDVDPTHGPVPIAMDLMQQEGAPTAAYPLREFTDEDIWTYIKINEVPFNRKRYTFNDLHANSDFFPACVKCMDKNGPKTVECPKLGVLVNNVSSELRQTVLSKYIG